jgi:hypothetical protein
MSVAVVVGQALKILHIAFDFVELDDARPCQPGLDRRR